jgi:hypothetical protein
MSPFPPPRPTRSMQATAHQRPARGPRAAVAAGRPRRISAVMKRSVTTERLVSAAKRYLLIANAPVQEEPVRPEHPGFSSQVHPARPRFERVLAVRDVPDVEAYVRETLDAAELPADDRELAELVRCGIDSVYRVERALPPEHPLTPVLDTALHEHLVETWESLQAERRDFAVPAVA